MWSISIEQGIRSSPYFRPCITSMESLLNRYMRKRQLISVHSKKFTHVLKPNESINYISMLCIGYSKFLVSCYIGHACTGLNTERHFD